MMEYMGEGLDHPQISVPAGNMSFDTSIQQYLDRVNRMANKRGEGAMRAVSSS